MKHTLLYTIALLNLLPWLLAGCGRPSANVPAQFEQLSEAPNLYPDYTDITIPPNIAPLNFLVRDSNTTTFTALFQGAGQELRAGADSKGCIRIDTTQWRSMLQASRGQDINVTSYAQRHTG